jgi:hypothetical protein
VEAPGRDPLAGAAAGFLLALWIARRGAEEALPPASPLAAAPAAPAPAPAAGAPSATGPPAAVVARREPATPPRERPAAERSPAPTAPLEPAAAGLPELADLREEDLALLLELEAVEDLEVIANLDLLERLLARPGAG